MKTIFLTSFNPFATRNILLSDVFTGFKSRQDIRVVIFCPDYKREYFTNNFSANNVVIEGIPSQRVTRQDILFNYLGRSIVDTSTLRMHRLEIYLRNRKLFNFIFSKLLAIVGRSRIVKRLIRTADHMTISKKRFNRYFDKYKPDLLFATDVFHVDDVHFLAEACWRGIKTIGMIRSWDNITGKGLFRVKPDKLIVNNEIIKKEAIDYEDFDVENIFVGGMPQFDYYFNHQASTRESFFNSLRFDKNIPTILVAPHGDRFYKYDWQLLEILKELPFQYIVRLPPNDFVDLSRFKSDPRFFIEHPGVEFSGRPCRDRELTRADSLRLADELYHCDLVITYSSTLIIDAAFFQKPVIMIAFDGWEQKTYIESERRYTKLLTHISKMLKTKCCRVAYDKEELFPLVAAYLKNPKLDSLGRANLNATQSHNADGKSGQKIAKYILEIGNLGN